MNRIPLALALVASIATPAFAQTPPAPASPTCTVSFGPDGGASKNGVDVELKLANCTGAEELFSCLESGVKDAPACKPVPVPTVTKPGKLGAAPKTSLVVRVNKSGKLSAVVFDQAGNVLAQAKSDPYTVVFGGTTAVAHKGGAAKKGAPAKGTEPAKAAAPASGGAVATAKGGDPVAAALVECSQLASNEAKLGCQLGVNKGKK